MTYMMKTKRATHYASSMKEIDRKAWLAKLLNEWVLIYQNDDSGNLDLVFNWPARNIKLYD